MNFEIFLFVEYENEIDSEMWKELIDLIEVKEVGVVYLMGYFFVKVKKFLFWLKKFVINFVYMFL